MRLLDRLSTLPLPGFFTFSSLLSLCALVGLLSFTAQPALAWSVYNKTGYTIRASISDVEGGSTKCGNWDDDKGEEINAGDNEGPNYTDTDCNPTGKRDSSLTMHIVIDNTGADAGFTSGEGRFSCFVNMLGGGFVLVYQQERSGFSDSSVAPNVYCASRFAEDKGYDSPDCSGKNDLDYNKDGQCTEIAIDWSDYFNQTTDPDSLPAMTPANRDVRFLATGDPQYWNSRIDGDTNYGVNETADAVMAKMKDLKLSTKQIRGIIVSGDLTQNARNDERSKYVDSISGIQRFVFDGLGNHDVASTGTSSHPKKVADYTGKKSRNTFPTKRPDSSSGKFPHYSWDWHDVHFVQLDLMPANDPAGGSYQSPDLDPTKALTFLENDLSENVGSSGRPIVLIHHYGFDCFSKGYLGGCSAQTNAGWWTDAQRIAYWNAIKNYNVIAIITGHVHLGTTDFNWRQDFDKPSGADSRSDGETSIPAFVAGAARGPTSCDDKTAACLNGVFLDVTIDNCNQFIVTRKDDHDNELDSDTIPFSTAGWGSVAAECTPVANCKSDLTLSADSSCQATTSIDAGSVGTCTVDKAAPYGLGTHTVTLTCTTALGSDSCKTKVTVEDQTKPELPVCSLASGQVECGAAYSYPEPTVSDNCSASSAPTVVCDPASGDLAALGTTEVQCTATDGAGNTQSCSSGVEVKDTLPPIVTTAPPDVTAECTGVRTIFTDVPLTPPVVTDQCDADLWVNSNAPETYPLGASTVTWTITDDSNNQTTVSNTVTLVDTTPPVVITPPPDVTAECTGVRTLFTDVPLTPPVVTDQCDADLWVNSNAPETYPLGASTVTWTITDDSSNQTTVSHTVTLVDTTGPTITCPADIVVEPEGPDGTVVTFNATATDSCDAAPLVECPDSGNTFGVGTETAVTCTATDTSNNQTPCSFTVKVLSEEEVINNLQDQAAALADNGVVNGGQENSLLSNLRNILGQIGASRSNAACGQLRGFVSKLNEWVADGTLAEAEAEALLTSVNNLQATLTCR